MKKRWMALLCAAAVTTTLFAGCGSTGAEQTGNNAGSTATEAAQGKDSASGEGMAQSVAGTADTVIVAMSRRRDLTLASTGAVGNTAMNR